MDVLEKRKEKALKFLKEYKNKIYYLLAIIIISMGSYIRTRNLPLLKDKFPLALDPYAFLRYATYIVENGKLFTHDIMRYVPLGYNTAGETTLLAYIIAYLYKIIHFFNSSFTVEKAAIIYPVIAFAIGTFFFFLIIKRIFNSKIALFSTALLTVVPAYLYRTMAGFADKEAFAMMLFFMIIYFYVLSFQSKNLKKSILFGGISGILTGLMGLSWGGVNFIFIILGSFFLIELMFNKASKKDFYVYSTWFLITLLIITNLGRFTLTGLMVSVTSGVMFAAFATGLIRYLIEFKPNLKSKIKEKLPLGLFSFLTIGCLTFIAISIKFGFSFIFKEWVPHIIQSFTGTVTDRWLLTVAESHQPYITDWIGNTSWAYMILFILGSIILFYNLLNKLKNSTKIKLTVIYSVFIISFIFSRYSASSKILNGVSKTSSFLYLGSLAIFLIVLFGGYLKSYYKNKENINAIKEIKKGPILIFIWFFTMVVGARAAIRLIFVFIPISSILIGYFFNSLLDYTNKIKKEKYYNLILKIGVLIIFLVLFIGFFNKVSYQAKWTGPSYNEQWQKAGEWVKENVPEEAVFAHWWDYGYWVQTGFKRATVTDGGNAYGYWNHLMGRMFLTAENEEEALPFLYTHEVTNALMIADEIGKYPAFSSIGSGSEYDRYAWLTTFMLDESQIQETREGTNLVYRGNHVTLNDFVFNENFFPSGNSIIGAFIINTNGQSLNQPQAILVYNSNQVQVPVNCLYVEGEKIEFSENGLPGCLILMPHIKGPTEVNPAGALLYVPERVVNTLFARLFLFNEETEYFKQIYNDQNEIPLSVYQGRVIGPLKIWEVNYPRDIQKNESYLETTYPDESLTKA